MRHSDPYALGEATVDSGAKLQLNVTYQSPNLLGLDLEQDDAGQYYLRARPGADLSASPTARDVQNCLNAFIRLRDAGDRPEQVWEFARAYGLLGFCEHTRIEYPQGLIAPPWMFSVDCSICSHLGRSGTREPIAAWIAMARHFHAIRRLTAAIRSNDDDQYKPRDFEPSLIRAFWWETITPDEVLVDDPDPGKERIRKAAMRHGISPWADTFALSPGELSRQIATALNFWQKVGSPRPSLWTLPDPKKPGHFTNSLLVRGLREHLVAQLLAVASSQADEYFCRICGEQIVTRRRPRLFLCEGHLSEHQNRNKAASARRHYQPRIRTSNGMSE
jgi:hypothetical protein